MNIFVYTTLEVKKLFDKTVIITGGFGDIGKATAEKFAQNGYNIALTYHNEVDVEFIEKLKSFGSDVLAMNCDQKSASAVMNFIASAMAEFGKIDACVLCAGKAEPEGFLSDKSIDIIDDIIQVNFRGNIIFSKEILKVFAEKKHGSLVIVTSIYGKYGGSMESVYSACKAGLDGLVRSLSVEVAPLVRVNAVSPGFIDTKMNSGVSAENKEYCKNQIPLAKLGMPKDVANAIYFLCSDESEYITGEILDVNGGALRF